MSSDHASVMLALMTGNSSLPHPSDFKVMDLVFLCVTGYLCWVAWDVFLGPLSKIPGPKLWAASNIPIMYVTWNGDEANAIQRLHDTYGQAVRVAPNQISYTHPAAWKDIYGHKSGGKIKSFMKDRRFYVGDNRDTASIIIADDANHTRHRRILAHSFSDKALREQEPLLKYWANFMIAKLKEVEALGKAVDMVAYYNYTTFDIMGDLTFAEPLHMLEGSEYSPWVKLIFGSIKIAGKVNVVKRLPFMPQLIQTFMPKSLHQKAEDHKKFSSDRVDRRLARDPGRPDLWSEILKRSDDGSGDATSGMSLDEMRANARLFMTAGTETTATLLSGLTYRLLVNPDKMDKIVAEVRTTFKDESEITMDALARLPYLNACIEEGLRMYPPVPIGLPRRVPEGGAAVVGQWIPRNTVVAVSHWAAYHDATNFRNPMSFVPERFLGDPEYAVDNLAALQPFSAGPRNCLGKNLAYHEMRLLLAMTLWTFDLSLEQESIDWANQKVFILWDKRPLMVKLRAVR